MGGKAMGGQKIRKVAWRAIWLCVAIALATASSSTGAQPAVEIIRVGIRGKLVEFAPFYVGLKLGIYRSKGLEPEFIVIRCSRRLRGEFSFGPIQWK